MNNLRLPAITRHQKLVIYINEKPYPAFQGETILAALIANGFTALRRSHRLKEARGALCGMGVCFECAVTVNGIPNIRSCMTEVENNMRISIHEFPET
jgi:sarcosine oxidase subunit alpha